jgi:hypothetical protein
VDVNGGAVELSWSIHKTDGTQSSCAEANLAQVALCLRSCDAFAAGLCRRQLPDGTLVDDMQCPFVTFSCDRLHGSTAFEIPPGRKELWIRPLCANATVLATAQVPESLLRDVTEGEVTELNALLITVPSQGPACGP